MTAGTGNRARKNNVLFIVIDQLRADAVFGALAEALPTPNLDAFRAGAVSFERHFTVTAPCGPSRASLLTGQYAMSHRAIRNGAPLTPGTGNIALEARKLGYEPLLFGYTDTQPDPSGLHPNDPDNRIYESVLPGFREIVEMRLEQGAEWPAYLQAKGYGTFQAESPDIWRLYRPEGDVLGGPALYRAVDSDTAYLTDRTLSAMAVRRSKPWFAHVTYIRPHPPFVAPAPYHRLVDPAAVPAPIQGVCDHPFVTAWQSERSQFGMFWGFDGDCGAIPVETAAKVRATYLGLLAEVDHHLGRLMQFLDDTGQRENTMVVLCADHGEMLGDHGHWGKDSVFEAAYHVPLMIRMPGGVSGRVTALTESVDIAPTILEWLGGVASAQMDGRSLMPWLRGEIPEDWRDAVMMEVEFGEPGQPTRFERAFGLPPEHCRAAILREARWKYVHFAGGVPPMLFDLDSAEGERLNRAGNPACAGELSRLRGRLLDRRLAAASRPFG